MAIFMDQTGIHVQDSWCGTVTDSVPEGRLELSTDLSWRYGHIPGTCGRSKTSVGTQGLHPLHQESCGPELLSNWGEVSKGLTKASLKKTSQL